MYFENAKNLHWSAKDKGGNSKEEERYIVHFIVIAFLKLLMICLIICLLVYLFTLPLSIVSTIYLFD